MQIIVDSNTQGVELYHLSILFQSLAGARGFTVPVQEYTVGVDITQAQAETAIAARVDNLTTVINAAGETLGSVDLGKPDSVEKSGDGVSYGYTITPPTIESEGISLAELNAPRNGEIDNPGATATNDNLDSAGLPWDARIHAGSRERNTDGSWRVRRRPKGVEEADWEATLARVTAELRDLMEIPVSTGAVADAAAETALTNENAIYPALCSVCNEVQHETSSGVTCPNGHGGADGVEDPEHAAMIDALCAAEPVTIAPPVAVAPPVVVVPPAVEPPVTAVAPPITTASPAIETFAQVMTFLTAHTPKDEAAKPAMVAKVNEILAANGLTVLTQLGQRPDLIPQVMTQFTEAFGE